MKRSPAANGNFTLSAAEAMKGGERRAKNVIRKIFFFIS
jgi:hypothetical protein